MRPVGTVPAEVGSPYPEAKEDAGALRRTEHEFPEPEHEGGMAFLERISTSSRASAPNSTRPSGN